MNFKLEVNNINILKILTMQKTVFAIEITFFFYFHLNFIIKLDNSLKWIYKLIFDFDYLDFLIPDC